ncbi:MAG: c-type cytochrome [Flavobacterium sp.]|nr:MAG: c-type cytochrome [Flavobacterium sp.]
MRILIGIIVLLLLASGFMAPADDVYFSIPDKWPKPAYDFTQNPLKAETIQLGRALFYDPTLSSDGQISCASCHSQYTAFAHVDHKLSHGVQSLIGNRNAPALFNLAWQKSFMWDGAVHNLDALALAPMTSPVEMNENLPNIVDKLSASHRYRQAFAKAYGDSAITGTRTLKAISQFLVTLISCNSKYDKVTRGETGIRFSDNELHGYDLFKQNCAACHAEPLFTNGEFENNGIGTDSILKDPGRVKISLRKRDSLRFKVPSLRNVEVTYPYMHDGRFANLQMVLFHYTEAIGHDKTLSKPLKKKIVLSENDKRDLISFLKTLTDETFLRDKRFSYPVEFFSR